MQRYHATQFWGDVQRIPVQVVPVDHALEQYRGIGFFASLKEVPVAEAHRPLFAVCFYFEALIDQGLHHFFPEAHARFQAARPLPKFGRFGMGPHIEPPGVLLTTAREHWALPRDVLAAQLAEGAAYFPSWMGDFFARERVPVTAVDLCRALGAQDLGDLGVVTWRGIQTR